MQGNNNQKAEHLADALGGVLFFLFIIAISCLIFFSNLHSALNFDWKKCTECKECQTVYFYEYKKDFCEKCGSSGDWNKQVLAKSQIAFEDVLNFNFKKAKIDRKEIENSSNKETH
jgi:hypothetical protein